MTAAATDHYDVFLSYAAADAPVAEVVERKLAETGLRVFSAHNLSVGSSWADAIRDALAESSAVVLLVTPTSLKSANLAVELGAAMAWKKQIFPLLQDVTVDQLPVYLRHYQAAPVSQVQAVADAVLAERSRLTPTDHQVLEELYEHSGIPADELAHKPTELAVLTRRFNRARKADLGPEQVLREFLRLHKHVKVRSSAKRNGGKGGRAT
ncbi:MAG: toll/interleukin-1 receptor domain-containing protein [Planctomycetes bacterium]|nr:toll/interleukin-1 receptor domain-containing protein [Planctomycetota bacterium]